MGEEMADFIDFADITNQIYRREMNRTYEFNLMLIGLAGDGKSSLVNSLFQGLIKPREVAATQLNEYDELLEENGVKLRLRCVETSKYRRHVSADYIKYIDDHLKAYFIAQRRQSTWSIRDTRVHCCLYLIPPRGTLRLDVDDIDCMRALHEKVNLIPVVAKADTFDPLELIQFKENILADLELNQIDYFKFQHDAKEDEDRFKAVKVEAERFPFAIISAKEPTLSADGKRHNWIRKTVLGPIDITNNEICDFDALAKLLIRHCMLDLIDSTHVKHYAKFKSQILETARVQGGKNLQVMGLEPHEIKRIEFDTNPKATNGSGKLATNCVSTGLHGPDKLRADVERELHTLKLRLQTLKVSSSVRS